MNGADLSLACSRDEALAAYYSREPMQEIEAPAKPPRKVFAFIPASEMLANVKPTDWTIRGYVPPDSFGAVIGAPECGKSFAVLGMACSVAASVPAYGLEVRKSGPVLVVIGEGRNAYANRIAAWSLHNRVAGHRLNLHVSTMATELTNEVAVAELEAVIDDFMRTHGAPVMVIIDTLARNFGPGDENSTSDMGRAIVACDRVRELTKAAVILVHHSGKDETRGARGSTALRGALDFEFRMSREGDVVRLEATKMKDAERPPTMAFRFERVSLGVVDSYGEEASSAVLVPLEVDETGRHAAPARVVGKHQKLALGLLRERYATCYANLLAQGRDESAAAVSIDDWRNLCADRGIDRRRFSDVRRALSDAGLVREHLGFAYLVEGAE